MEQMVLVDKTTHDSILKQLEELTKAVTNITNKPNITEGDSTDWISLKRFLATYDICKKTWYDFYKHKIEYRNDGKKLWINKASMEAYLKDKAINKK